MSVVSKVFDSIGNEIIKCLLDGKKFEGNINIGDYKGKLIITVDIVKSREEKSKSGIDIWVSFDWGIVRININVS